MVYEILKVDDVETKVYYDQWLHEKITKKWLGTIKRDDDLVICIDGGEGAGKSVFAFQIAKLLDNKFDLKNICMNANEFKKQIKEAHRGDCVVYDEAFTGLSSKGALTEINKILVELMMEMRQKNLKVLIVLPTFFMLEKYVALFRARCLFHVYRKRGSRGHWMFFGKKKKKLLYLLGKKFLSYKEPRSEKKGRFLNTYTINEQQYREKKDKAFVSKDRSGREERWKYQRDILFWYLTKKLGIGQEVLTDMYYFFGMDLDRPTISKDITHLEEKIIQEVEHPPDDEFILRLVKMIQTRNEPTMREIRKQQLENRAKKEIEREKRLLGKALKLKEKEKSQKSKSEVLISENIEENKAFEEFLESE